MDSVASLPPERRLYCNRTLNLRSIKAIGYDMDYTLVHYQVEVWEHRAFEWIRDELLARGWPVGRLRFDPELAIRGLVIDREQGNLLKANRFGYVKKAFHGTTPLPFETMRRAYARRVVDPAEPRWDFLNTLFSLSEACLYAQLVDLLDEGKLPGPMGYADLHAEVRRAVDDAHMEGQLKREIGADPERYVVEDPETPLTLLDQRGAGKKLLLITNSGWGWADAMMRFAFEPHLPVGMSWRELFDVIIVGAHKPEFFTAELPLFEVLTSPGREGLLRPHTGPLVAGIPYAGGSASVVERSLGVFGEEILYVGDHMFGDVHVTKRVLRWRTALILRELEEEIRAISAFRPVEARVASMMAEKERLEARDCQVRLALQRLELGYGPVPALEIADLESQHASLQARLRALDLELAPLARAASELSNPSWGLLTRAGNDKSLLARVLEHYADIYTSRVSNFLWATPFVYLRSPRGSLPHDPGVPGGTPLFSSSDDAGATASGAP